MRRPFLSESLVRDFTFAVRMLAKDRRFTIAAVMALGLGIGVNNAAFTLVNTALIRDLPFERPDELVMLRSLTNKGAGRRGMSQRELDEYRRSATAFADLGASLDATMTLGDDEHPPERVRGTFASANLLPLLGRAPVLGRSFQAPDTVAGAPPVVILSDSVWRRRYLGDPQIVGRTVRVNDIPATVIGVMPPGFKYPLIAQIWQPLTAAPAPAASTAASSNLAVVGRLAVGAERAGAQRELDATAARLARVYPDTNAGVTVAMEGLIDGLRQGTRPILLTIMGAVGFVLLTACANLAALLLARAANRSREMAIRLSLGATRWRISRLLLMECALIAAMAAVVGLALSGYGARLLAVGFNIIDPGAAPEDTTPYWVNLTMNHSAYFFVGVIALVSTFAFGLVPALQLSRTDVIATLKDNARGASGSPSARRWTAGLMVGQLALTMILLSATALLWRNFIAATNADVIDTSDLVTARFTLPLPKYDPARRQQLLHQYSSRIAASGAVGAATLTTSTPFEPPATRLLSIEGRPAPANEPRPGVGVVQTDGQFFRTVRLPIVRGRAFSGAAGTTEVVINERLAALFFADGDAIGRQIRLIETPGETASRSLTIAGIARAMPVLGRGVPDRLIVYVPWDAFPEPPRTLTVIARGSVRSAVVSTLREELRTLDAGVPLFGVEPMAAAVARTAYPQRLLGTWFGLLAAIALVLAVVGLYATTAYGVVRRTQEIGVRMALGARTAQVFLLFLRQAIWRIALGLTIGLGGALGLGRLLSSFLERTGPRDPLTLTAVAVLLAGAGATASLLPAWRAARIDPADALRSD